MQPSEQQPTNSSLQPPSTCYIPRSVTNLKPPACFPLPPRPLSRTQASPNGSKSATFAGPTSAFTDHSSRQSLLKCVLKEDPPATSSSSIWTANERKILITAVEETCKSMRPDPSELGDMWDSIKELLPLKHRWGLEACRVEYERWHAENTRKWKSMVKSPAASNVRVTNCQRPGTDSPPAKRRRTAKSLSRPQQFINYEASNDAIQNNFGPRSDFSRTPVPPALTAIPTPELEEGEIQETLFSVTHGVREIEGRFEMGERGSSPSTLRIKPYRVDSTVEKASTTPELANLEETPSQACDIPLQDSILYYDADMKHLGNYDTRGITSPGIQGLAEAMGAMERFVARQAMMLSCLSEGRPFER
ncbi:hypothetical protein P7C70_g5453, partial [Phenoliferia sp. Uapishka_3]